MPHSIDALDWFASMGHRPEHGDYNLATQTALSPMDEVAQQNHPLYVRLFNQLGADEQFKERRMVYLQSPLMEYAQRISTLSPAQRLAELRKPESSLRWAYSFIFDHMLGCVLSPQANSFLDVYDAASKGHKKFHKAINYTRAPVYNTHVFTAELMLKHYRYKAPSHRIRNALTQTVISDSKLDSSNDDECPICYDALCEETSDRGWDKANPEELSAPPLMALIPDFVPLICAWNKSDFAKSLSATCCEAQVTIMECNIAVHYGNRALERKMVRPSMDHILDFRPAFAAKFKSRVVENKKKYLNVGPPKEGFVVELDCKHKFHRICIRRWFGTDGHLGTCPYCRHDIAKFEKLSKAEMDLVYEIDQHVTLGLDPDTAAMSEDLRRRFELLRRGINRDNPVQGRALFRQLLEEARAETRARERERMEAERQRIEMARQRELDRAQVAARHQAHVRETMARILARRRQRKELSLAQDAVREAVREAARDRALAE